MKILNSRELFMSPFGEQIPLMIGESPAVWLTSSNKWEETCFIDLGSTFFEEYGKARITVKYNSEYKRASSKKKKLPLWELLSATGKRVGSNPKKDWYVKFSNIPISDFISIEFLKDDKWIEYEFNTEDAKLAS